MFADDVGMNVLRVHPETTSQQRTEACSVEHCARADNASGWHSSGCGEMRREMSHDVYGIRYDHQDRVTCMFQNGRYHLLEDCSVPLEELQPGLARPLRNTCGDDHHPAIYQVRVLSGANHKRMSERHCVQNVVCLSLGTNPIDIHEYNLPTHAVHNQGEARSRSHHPATDYANFHQFDHIVLASFWATKEVLVRRIEGKQLDSYLRNR